MEAKSYFFISHSSKDLEKVRKIRNLIESLDGNPILFYLKCMDNDSPTGQDEIELKSLLYREIAAREKVILCKSINTEPPNETKWIKWEKNTIRELANKLRPFEIDLDDADYMEKVRKIVMRFKNLLITSTYTASNKAYKIVNYLRQSLEPYNITISTLYESGDMICDMTSNHGQYVKEIIKNRIQECDMENKSLVLFLSDGDESFETFGQMIYAFSNRLRPF